ncbi:MAG: YlxR family protein [Armatimonadetes bacterium]|nr:YlxR family protein [Armatimonadota bacterium]
MARVKKVPLRMCVGCREMKPKKELIRIVRTPEEKIAIDPTGKRAGRGAYVCPNRVCVQKAIKARSIERALQCSLAKEVIEDLMNGLGEEA